MTEKLKQIIKEELINLPKESQDAINIFDWGTISEEIGKKYLLDEDEINDFQVETGLVLIGLVEANEYKKNIENKVGTSKEDAEKIAKEINQKIFTPIYEILSENIKENIKNKKINWKQNLDFIYSGGNYLVFLEKNENKSNLNKIPITTIPNNSRKIEDIKNKFNI